MLSSRNSPLGREELISKMHQKMQSSWSCYRVDLVSPRSFLEYFHEYENHTYKKSIKKIPNKRILSTMNKERSSMVCDLRSWTNTIENFSSSGTRCILYLLKNHIMFIFKSNNGVNDIDMMRKMRRELRSFSPWFALIQIHISMNRSHTDCPFKSICLSYKALRSHTDQFHILEK